MVRTYKRVFGRGNIFTFMKIWKHSLGRRYAKIFLGLIFSRHSYQNIPISHMRLQYSHGMGIFFLWKDQITSIINHFHPLQDDAKPLLFAKGIFGNIQNIFGNLIHLWNTVKNTCLKKLFSRITFSEILFSEMKIQTSYQTSPKGKPSFSFD